MRLSRLLLIGALILPALAPLAALVVAWLFLLAQAALVLVRLIAGIVRQPPAPRRAGPAALPVFTVHVATHNEPPALVIATLDALAAQDYAADRFEVVVMDNNTTDPALWRPVRAHCQRLGPRFRFLHREDVTGAKAGALNIALAAARPDATHVVTVDADYVCAPDFLSQAAAMLRETRADFLQYPQAYRAPRGRGDAIELELSDYFQTDARAADCTRAVLLTGTLSVIDRAALAAVGGWTARSTTEDAELGVRLCRAGYFGRFVDRVVGVGQMPLGYAELQKQRHRWASGNLRTLMLHARALPAATLSGGLPRCASVLAQLMSWLNFGLIPAGLLLGGLAAGAPADVTLVAAATVVLVALSSTLRLMRRAHHQHTGFSRTLRAVLARLALVPVSALATMDALLGERLRFQVTAKTAARASLWPVLATALPGLAALVLLPAALAHGPLQTCAALALISLFPAAALTAREVHAYSGALQSPALQETTA